MDYEKLLREKESKMSIWGKESVVIIDEDIEISKNVVINKLSWIEEHKDEIIEFALSVENGILYGINDAISDVIVKKGRYKLIDGTILQNIIEKETLIKSIYVDSVYFTDIDFGIDLATSPDFFGGHLLAINVNLENNEMEYDGMDG